MSILELKRLLHKIIFYIPNKLHPAKLSHASICLTRACNGKCPMCLRTHDSPHAAGMMSREIFAKTVTELVSAGVRDVHIFNMGEPLIHPHFIEFVQKLLDNGLRPNFSTNGELFSEKFYPIVSKIRHPGVSIEGYDKETVKKYRGINFDAVYRNIKGFSEYPNRNGSFILRTAVYKSMDEEYMKRFVETWGPFFDEIQFAPAAPPQVSAIKDRRIKEFRSDDFYSFCYNENAKCEVPQGAIIQPDGSVLVCPHDYENLKPIGDIREQTWTQILSSAENKDKFQKMSVNEDNVCGNCWSFLTLNPEDEVVYNNLVALAQSSYKVIKNR